MKISKKDALTLAKVLHQHVGHCALVGDGARSEFQDTLEDLSARVDEFLVYGDEVDDDECEHDCCADDEEEGDKETEDDDEDKEDPSEEGGEEDDEEEDEDEDSSEEDDDGDSEDEDEGLDVDSYVGGAELHDLTAVKSDDGAVEFEHVEGDDYEDPRVDLLVDGYTKIEGVTHIRRQGKELHVRDSDAKWSVFYVTKFPKAWVSTLPLSELVEVEGYR